MEQTTEKGENGMDLNIGEIIAGKRKGKRWTQEQLADTVGVSAPAVSKWESGATYPDITLLSPIARALDTTVDALLSYRSELTADEVKALAGKAAGIYEAEGFDAGWAFCAKLYREYPNSIPLKFSLGNLYQQFLILKPGLDDASIQIYYRETAERYEEVLASGAPEYAYRATTILISCYIVLKELDKAEALLECLPRESDPDFWYFSIYALRGKKEESIRLIQKNLLRTLPQISQSLNLLCAFALEDGDTDTAFSLAETGVQLSRLFGIQEYLPCLNRIKVLLARGDAGRALDELEDYANRIVSYRCEYPQTPVFRGLTNEKQDVSFFRKALAKSLLIDPQIAQLENEPRYQAIMEPIRALAEEETHTFRS